jgi:tetratricopeptide (TPR) repeat protein
VRALRDVDTDRFESLEEELTALSTGELCAHAELAFALGRLRAMRDDLDAARDWLSRAFSRVGPNSAKLAARIGFELGAVHIRRGELLAADTVLASSEGLAGTEAADVLHLRAVLSELRGDLNVARDLYRRTIVAAPRALSSITHVLAMRNLAELLLHVDPKEGVALTGLALRSVEVNNLDPRLRPSILNTRSYALSCLGEVDAAAKIAAAAEVEARQLAQPRIQLYARFNRAIADELRGDLASAAAALNEVARKAEAIAAGDMVTWAKLRSLWLQLLTHGPATLGEQVKRAFPEPVAEPYRRTVTTLRALVTLSDIPSAPAIKSLGQLIESYAADGDDLTAFALLLWLAFAHARSGRPTPARRALRRAYEVGATRGFRLTPNWWSHEIVLAARSLARDDDIQSYLSALYSVPCGRLEGCLQPRKPVVIRPDAQVIAGGEALPPSCWREGRSGPKVLQRFFRVLAEAHPQAVARDALVDLLWPESDGASAIQNLYAATHDLRRVVTTIPGVQVVVEDQRYRLTGEANVTFEMDRKAERTAD